MGFIADSQYIGDQKINGLPILGSIDWLKNKPEVKVVVAIGSPSLRCRIVGKIENQITNSFPVGKLCHFESGRKYLRKCKDWRRLRGRNWECGYS